VSEQHNDGLPEHVRLIDDMHLGRPHVIGTYLLLGDEPAIVDPGPASVLPALERGLRAHGLELRDLRAVLLTHIHLDHAGATGSLVRALPHLRVYVHERGAPHMAAPEKLIRSATRLYGERMDELWGEILPVPSENLTALVGGETLRLGRLALQVYDAPGHASHHLLYLDGSSGTAFVGDTAGVRMPGSAYVCPATPPPDIDLEAWRRTLDQLEQFGPRLLCLTHFGPAHDPAAHIDALWRHTLSWAETVRKSLESGEEEKAAVERLEALAAAQIAASGSDATPEEYARAASVEMSWQGLARYWRKRAASP